MFMFLELCKEKMNLSQEFTQEGGEFRASKQFFMRLHSQVLDLRIARLTAHNQSASVTYTDGIVLYSSKC